MLRSVDATFCDDAENGGEHTVTFIGQDFTHLELSGPGKATDICIVVSAKAAVADPFAKVTFRLFRGDEQIDAITYWDQAVAPRLSARPYTAHETYQVDHIFPLPEFVLFLEANFKVRTYTEREELPEVSLKLSFESPF